MYRPGRAPKLDFWAAVAPVRVEVTFDFRRCVRYRAKGEPLIYTVRANTAVVDRSDALDARLPQSATKSLTGCDVSR